MPIFLLLTFKLGLKVLVGGGFVQDLCFMKVCCQAYLPDLQLRLLYYPFLLAQRLLEYFPAP